MRRMVSKWFLREPTRCRLCLRGYGSFLFSIAAWFVAMKPGCWELQRNPDVPPTLLPFPFPHGTPPTTGPEKSHQFCPPLWTQHKCIIFTILGLPGYVSPILVKQVSGSLGDRFANLNAYARTYAEPTRSLRGDTRFPVRTLEFSAHPRLYVFIAGGRSLTFTKPITVAPQTV